MELYTPYKEELDKEQEKFYAELARNGDSDAILRLIGSVGKWICRVISMMSRPPSISDQDIYDEISSSLLFATQSFDPDKSRFVTYITHIVRFKSRDAINRLASNLLRPRSRVSNDENTPEVISLGSVDTNEFVETEEEAFYHVHIGELASIVQDIIGDKDHFRQHWKQILELRMKGLSIIECAQTIGMPRKYVENALDAMKSYVSSELKKRETDCSVWLSREPVTKQLETMWD